MARGTMAGICGDDVRPGKQKASRFGQAKSSSFSWLAAASGWRALRHHPRVMHVFMAVHRYRAATFAKAER